MTDTEYRETIDYLFGLQMVGIKLGLDNIRALLDVLDNPHLRYPVVHIAGTNGKGSTAAFLASVLTASGYRTGLYTSPHLVDFSERIRIDGEPVPEEYVAEFTARVRPHIDEHSMTFFEATTAMAFRYFADNTCEIAVIETGLGGRLDATNVVTPDVTIITSLALEHTEFLGATIEEIAAEKGGIIKEGVPLITGAQQPEALVVLEDLCARRMTTLQRVTPPADPPVYHDVDRMTIELDLFGEPSGCELELVGDYQAVNAELAVRAAEALHRQGQKRVTPVTIRDGLRHVRKNAGIAGRMLRTGNDPETIVDVAHNPAAVEALFKTLAALRRPEHTHLVFGLMGTKDYREIVRIIASYPWATVTAVQAAARGALEKERLADALREAGIEAAADGSVVSGVRGAQGRASRSQTVLVFGSHYVAGEFLAETDFMRRGA